MVAGDTMRIPVPAPVLYGMGALWRVAADLTAAYLKGLAPPIALA